MTHHTQLKNLPLNTSEYLVGIDVNGVDSRTLASTLTGSGGAVTSDYLNPKNYGANGTGASRPLSTVYTTLPNAQIVYPFATSLTQQIDYCAFKKMSNLALGADGVENAAANATLNIPMYIPAGNYNFGADTWTIRNAVGIKITGAGRLSSRIFGTGIVLAFDGLWYSQISGLTLECVGSGITALDIDGNVPAHPYATRGVQANHFSDCLFQNLITNSYCVTMTRQGSSGGQGSENLFVNCHFYGATEACYYQLSFNALNNTFFGGNFQGYSKNGIQLASGHVNVFSVGFQSTTGYQQILNDGWDINCQGGGVSDKISVAGCRTESLRFLKNGGATPIDVRTITHNVSLYIWSANSAVALNTATLAISPDGTYKLYVVTTAGTSGGVAPVWPSSGTVVDGTAIWTMIAYTYIHVTFGSVDIPSCQSPVNGSIVQLTNFFMQEITANYTMKPHETLVLANAAAGPITISVPDENSTDFSYIGKVLTFKKYDASANAVTIEILGGSNIDFTAPTTIPGGSRGSLSIMCIGGGVLARRWFIVGRT